MSTVISNRAKRSTPISYKKLFSTIFDDPIFERRLEIAIEKLPPQPRKVIKLRYGIGDVGGPHTDQQIAKILGISIKAVQEAASRGLKGLQHPKSIHSLAGEMFDHL